MRRFSTFSLQSLRNIGICAHVDAGKTTLTENMLLYSGAISRAGSVDSGSTVTDFLPQERERGITIKAAAVTLGWAGHTINLIDTPGHIDFSVEVERSLRVLDGAVCLLDGVSGVQPQTETVWTQANRYGISRIGLVNKLDREGASYEATAQAIASRLQAVPLLLHLPLGSAGQFAGVVNLLTLDVEASGGGGGASGGGSASPPAQPFKASLPALLAAAAGGGGGLSWHAVHPWPQRWPGGPAAGPGRHVRQGQGSQGDPAAGAVRP